MTITFMRKVDYWVGIPLTTILSLGIRLTRLLKTLTKLEDVQRVLFIELSEMGSAILADPALKRVSQTKSIYFVIFKKNAVSLRIFNTVPEAQVFTIRDDSFFSLSWDVLCFLFWCRKNKIQAVIDLELFSRFTAILSALSSASVRIGFYNPRSEGLYRGSLLSHPVSYNPHIHISKNIYALTEPLMAPKSYSDPLVRRKIEDAEITLDKVTPAGESIDRVQKALAQRVTSQFKNFRYFLVNINAGDFLPQRKWPKSNFEAFTKLLLEKHNDVVVLLTGSPKERPGVEETCQKVNSSRCINIAGDLRFEDLPALYFLSDGILTNDSGPGHFASAVGLRTFVLFGPETPALYGPLRNATSIYAGLACSPCVYATNHRDTPCQDNQCLKIISPEFVLHQVDQYLKQTSKLIVNSHIVPISSEL